MTISLSIVIFSIQWLSSLCVKAQIYAEAENNPRGSGNSMLLNIEDGFGSPSDSDSYSSSWKSG
jgi:hypothetical protein